MAACYVSGYLETLPPPGQPKLQGADASHAWFAVFVPGTGWVDFDPTNAQVPREQHITTALGRDFHDVTPVRGVFYGGGEHRLEVEVDIPGLGSLTAPGPIPISPANKANGLPHFRRARGRWGPHLRLRRTG